MHDGRLVWIVDCYTTSDHFPYSQRNAEGINYIRNSVKVVVDAYNGTTEFYVADPTDPITGERVSFCRSHTSQNRRSLLALLYGCRRAPQSASPPCGASLLPSSLVPREFRSVSSL